MVAVETVAVAIAETAATAGKQRRRIHFVIAADFLNARSRR
jgi:hypothetical protein